MFFFLASGHDDLDCKAVFVRSDYLVSMSRATVSDYLAGSETARFIMDFEMSAKKIKRFSTGINLF